MHLDECSGGQKHLCCVSFKRQGWRKKEYIMFYFQDRVTLSNVAKPNLISFMKLKNKIKCFSKDCQWSKCNKILIFKVGRLHDVR